jgi:cytochrome P450
LGANLLTSEGDNWLRQRRLIQHGFRADKLISMAAAMCSCLEESPTRLDEKIRFGPIDICPQMKAITLKMTASSLFSAALSDEDIRLISQMVATQFEAIKAMRGFAIRQIVQTFLAPWFALLGGLRRRDAVRRELDKILLRLIRHRQSGRDQADDLLQILLEARYGDTGEGATDEQILSETRLFVIAGHESTSNALCWTLYLLSQHPDYLRRVRDELKGVVGEGPLGCSHFASLTLTRQIIEESLRLYPPFWLLDRIALADDRAGDVSVPKGTTIIAFIYGAHRAPTYWRAPDDFLPERFNDDRSIRLDFHYLPFGRGPRGCIGSSHAMLQMLITLNGILRRYNFALVGDEPVEPRASANFHPKHGMIMRFERLMDDETQDVTLPGT